MSNFIDAIALGVVHYADPAGKPTIANAGEALKLSPAHFDELAALGAVRAPKTGEKVPQNPLDHDNDGTSGGFKKPEGDALQDKTVAELRAIAEAEGVDLTDVTLKADIIAAIEQGRENLLA